MTMRNVTIVINGSILVTEVIVNKMLKLPLKLSFSGIVKCCW